jgi:hypothetical protein
MVEQYYPSTTELMRQSRNRRAMMTALLCATVAVVFGTIGALLLLTNIQPVFAWLLGLVAFTVFAIPVMVWHSPRGALYGLFIAALLFGGSPGAYFDVVMPTSLVPFWWNVSIIAQNWKVTALNGFAFSPAELVMIMITLTWLIKGIVSREMVIWRGPMFAIMLVYVAMVTFGFLHGKFRGGDTIVALWEVRTQFHLLLAYVLVSNLIKDLKQVMPLYWMVIICAAIQSILSVIKYQSLGGVVPDAGFAMHDVAFTLDVGLFMCLLLIVIPFDRKLLAGALVGLPIILAGILVNQRRGAIGAAVIAFVPLLPLAWTLFPQWRSRVGVIGAVIVAVSAIYFPLAWNASGPWALPARALRSQSDPNERDANSNNYRMAEDQNLKYTRDTQPWTGIGYGRPFIQVNPMPLIDFPMKDYLPHNGVMWVWMRLGHFGFLAFLMMLFTIIIKGIQVLKRVSDPALKVIGMLSVLTVTMLLVYSKYDMQLISPRSVFVTFALVGLCSAIARFGAAPEGEAQRPEAELQPAPV